MRKENMNCRLSVFDRLAGILCRGPFDLKRLWVASHCNNIVVLRGQCWKLSRLLTGLSKATSPELTLNGVYIRINTKMAFNWKLKLF